MAKRRERKVNNPLRDQAVPNPLNMEHVEAIGVPPEARRQEREEPPAVEVPDSRVAVEERRPSLTESKTPSRTPPARADQSSRSRMSIAPQRAPKTDAEDTRQLKTRISPQEAQHFEALRMELGERLGVKVSGSQITRALFTLALRAQEELDGLRPPDLRRPSYGDPLGMAAFEDAIAEYLLAAIKRTRKLD